MFFSVIASGFIGETNLLPCQVINEKDNEVTVSSEELNIITQKVNGISLHDKAFISIRPHTIKLGNVQGLTNVYQVIVKNIIFHGDDMRFIVETETGTTLNLITGRRDDYEKLNNGQKVKVGWDIQGSTLVKRI